MKLTENTINTLKNFSTINAGLVMKEGRIQKTISPEQTVLVEAELEEDFPMTFGIYDLNRFLGNITTLDSPELVFHDKYMEMKDSVTTLKYFYCDTDNVDSPPDKALSIENPTASFELNNTAFNKLLRLANLNTLPNLTVVGKDGGISLQVHDKNNDLSNQASMRLCDYSGTDFTACFKADHLKMIPDDYSVKLIQDKFALFEAKNRKLKYFIALLTK